MKNCANENSISRADYALTTHTTVPDKCSDICLQHTNIRESGSVKWERTVDKNQFCLKCLWKLEISAILSLGGQQNLHMNYFGNEINIYLPIAEYAWHSDKDLKKNIFVRDKISSWKLATAYFESIILNFTWSELDFYNIFFENIRTWKFACKMKFSQIFLVALSWVVSTTAVSIRWCSNHREILILCHISAKFWIWYELNDSALPQSRREQSWSLHFQR